ncbi:hypothetical protein CDAR_396731 [Caerostris darwini]|uniref:Uncharacterized protein n=1 Tax=Caerostris darwini TaxID=1538125 RepID=A0AAV4PP41_9ARAC|nr:hypothetical protein CDAR_396731 [Caerostris darwini]
MDTLFSNFNGCQKGFEWLSEKDFLFHFSWEQANKVLQHHPLQHEMYKTDFYSFHYDVTVQYSVYLWHLSLQEIILIDEEMEGTDVSSNGEYCIPAGNRLTMYYNIIR